MVRGRLSYSAMAPGRRRTSGHGPGIGLVDVWAISLPGWALARPVRPARPVAVAPRQAKGEPVQAREDGARAWVVRWGRGNPSRSSGSEPRNGWSVRRPWRAERQL